MAESIIGPGKNAGNKDRSFSRQHSLRGRSNFLAIMNHKDSIMLRGRYCVLRYLDSASRDSLLVGMTRFGIMASRKTGGAVRRNRLKRVVREFLRNNKHLWPQGKMIIIQMKAPITNEEDLLAEISDMLPGMR